jgi:hypothetical protein
MELYLVLLKTPLSLLHTGKRSERSELSRLHAALQRGQAAAAG